MNVGLAYPAFVGSFLSIFPTLKVIREEKDFNIIPSLDLLIFSGGEDISPDLYGEKNTYSISCNQERDIIERKVFNCATNYDNVKMLGICRGHQLLNVLCGGSLYQDIRFNLNRGHPGTHKLSYHKSDSLINDIFTKVNSMHHQCVKDVGYNLYITSSYDGIIESCESSHIITTQFHPEFMDGSEVDLFWDKIIKWVEIKEKRQKKSIYDKISKKTESVRPVEGTSFTIPSTWTIVQNRNSEEENR